MRNRKEIEELVTLWEGKLNDNKLLNELKGMNENEKYDAFCEEIEFGTGGLRGIMGVGTNRMNYITVGKVTMGLVNYLQKIRTSDNLSVAIGYDPRHMHQEFLEKIITILATNNIKVFIFDDIKPTPMLSYLVRFKKCDLGIMLTASHNPKEYNGYKVYNNSGAQLNLEESAEMIAEVNKIENIWETNFLNFDEVKNTNLIEYIDESFDELYLTDIEKSFSNRDAKNLKIVFTPEHGTSYKIVPKALKYFGFNNLIEVKEQMVPDPDFSKTKSANPEEILAYELALEYANNNNADLIIANDPDADRLGIIFKNRKGEYIPFTGNQTGSLMIDYIINRDNLQKGIIYKTIVTGELGANIARRKGLKIEETLTGFKFIGDAIKNNKTDEFIFGYEESYGYLINKCVRDKDAIQASILIAEMVEFYKNKDIYLDEKLAQIYEEYGSYYEVTKSISLAGQEGLNKIKNIMNYYRTETISEFVNIGITQKIDYTVKQENLPKADVIKFYLEAEKGWIVFRPSGTEPKLKIYLSVKEENISIAEKLANDIYAEILNTMNNI